MRVSKTLALAIMLLFVSLTAFGQNVVFDNNDGTWTWSPSGTNADDLVLTSSTLTEVTGLPSAYDCSTIATCNGTVNIVTGALTSSTTSLQPGPCNAMPDPCTSPATFAAGGSFMVADAHDLSFSGDFSSETWQKSGPPGSAFWTFTGVISNATLTIGGTTFNMINAGTFDITTVGQPPSGSASTGYTWTDKSGFGSTNFPSPVPEPSTLALFGSGLVCVGLWGRRKLLRKTRDVGV